MHTVKEFQLGTHTDTRTHGHTDIRTYRAASSQLKMYRNKFRSL